MPALKFSSSKALKYASYQELTLSSTPALKLSSSQVIQQFSTPALKYASYQVLKLKSTYPPLTYGEKKKRRRLRILLNLRRNYGAVC